MELFREVEASCECCGNEISGVLEHGDGHKSVNVALCLPDPRKGGNEVVEFSVEFVAHVLDERVGPREEPEEETHTPVHICHKCLVKALTTGVVQ